MIAPTVSVVMPVYNCESFINDSINSILNQTFSDFEFLIIDDASTDRTLELVEEYQDSRIIVLKKQVNTGYTNSLNMAIKMAKGKYIARMDADDTSRPNRFQLQYDYLEQNPEILVLGTKFKIMFSETIVHHPDRKEKVRIKALTDTPVGHPTVFIRKEVFTKYKLWYNKEREPAEDYDLWCRILDLGEITNLNEVLLEYRIHDSQTSEVRAASQQATTNKIRKEQLRKFLNFDIKSYDLDFSLNLFLRNYIPVDRFNYDKVKSLLIDFYKANLVVKKFNEELLVAYLHEIWLFYLFQIGKSDLRTVARILFILENEIVVRIDMRMRLKFAGMIFKKLVKTALRK